MKFKLVGDQWQSGREICLDRFPVVLGRGSTASVQLNDRWVSQTHCQLDTVEGRLIVRDLGSKNGTLINGQYAMESHLAPGDKLSVGLSTFVVACEMAGD